MANSTKKKLVRATFIYWMLLTYIVAALVWWFISLEKQNEQMRDFKSRQLVATVDSSLTPGRFDSEMLKINHDYKRGKAKFFSEGCVFLILIAIGAAFVYRSVRRQFNVQQQQQNFMM